MLRLRMFLISCDLNADTIMHLHRKSAVRKEPSDAVCQLKYMTLMRALCPGLWNRELLNKHFVFEQEAPSNWRSGVNASSRLGDEPCEPTVRLPDWSEFVASYSRMKSA